MGNLPAPAVKFPPCRETVSDLGTPSRQRSGADCIGRFQTMRTAAAIIAITLAAVPLAHAQAPATAPAAPPAAVPEAMPFDIPYGTPIGMDQAHKAILAAVNEARKHNWKMFISV